MRVLKHGIVVLFVLLSWSCKTGKIDTPEIVSGAGNDYARLFSLMEKDNYYRLDIFSPWQGGEDIVITYFLSESVDNIPENAKKSHFIQIPVSTCVCLSTTHIAMIDASESVESIIGVSGTDYVSNTRVIERIDSGLVKDIGYDSNLNTELITILNPDVVFVYGIGSESAGYISKLETVNIPALYICDYLETHPLAKAEWVKLFGLLFNATDKTSKLFDEVKDSYEVLRDSIESSIDSRPRVMLGLPYKDKWFISPGNSYINTLIDDAGGDYIWKKHSSNESMPLSIESVFREALFSDVWLNIGTVRSKAELLSLDSRFGELPPVSTGNLYNNTLQTNRSGGNDYWESGSISPHLILKDIASLLHPELIRDHELNYYIKID